MRKTLWLLLVLASQALAQSPARPPQQEPERKAAPSESRLNLRLEEADLRSLSRSTDSRAPAEEKSADTLPSLGGDARELPSTLPKSGSRIPYPQDSERVFR
jgi:hypothetical protein